MCRNRQIIPPIFYPWLRYAEAMKKKRYRGLANCLRKYRKTRGLKQRQVANLLGLKSTAMISRWEKGDCFPDWENLFKLAIIYSTMSEALYLDHVKVMKTEIQEKRGIVPAN